MPIPLRPFFLDEMKTLPDLRMSPSKLFSIMIVRRNLVVVDIFTLMNLSWEFIRVQASTAFSKRLETITHKSKSGMVVSSGREMEMLKSAPVFFESSL